MGPCLTRSSRSEFDGFAIISNVKLELIKIDLPSRPQAGWQSLINFFLQNTSTNAQSVQ